MLLKVAKKTVPRLEWKRTPVFLRATAGLRLLPADKAQALLDQVTEGMTALFTVHQDQEEERKSLAANLCDTPSGNSNLSYPVKEQAGKERRV